jgi:hypothetical protein
MRAFFVLFTCLFTLSVSAEEIDCSQENSSVYVHINQENQTGHIDIDNMCINLICTSHESWLSCEGLNNSDDNYIGYYVTIIEKLSSTNSEAMIVKTNGISYDTVAILSCSTPK